MVYRALGTTAGPANDFRNQRAQPNIFHFLCVAGWINESMKVQETDPNFHGTVNYDHQLVYTIHHDLFDIPYDANRTMAPSWYVQIVRAMHITRTVLSYALSHFRPRTNAGTTHQVRTVLRHRS